MAFARPGDTQLRSLVESLFDYPDVPDAWRQPDFSQASEPVIVLRLHHGDDTLAFLTTVTVFDAPQNITVQELRIESYFPINDATEQACQRLG